MDAPDPFDPEPVWTSPSHRRNNVCGCSSKTDVAVSPVRRVDSDTEGITNNAMEAAEYMEMKQGNIPASRVSTSMVPLDPLWSYQ